MFAQHVSPPTLGGCTIRNSVNFGGISKNEESVCQSALARATRASHAFARSRRAQTIALISAAFSSFRDMSRAGLIPGKIASRPSACDASL